MAKNLMANDTYDARAAGLLNSAVSIELPPRRMFELFQAIGRFEPTFIEAYQALETICKVRSLKSQIKTRSFLFKIITSSKVVFKDFESDMAVGIRNHGNATRKTTEANDTVKQTPGSQIVTLQLQAKKSDL